MAVAFISYAVTLAVHRQGGPAAVTLSPSTTLHRGATAPEHFSLNRLGGGTLSLGAAIHGRPAVVNFFASWCTLCRSELTDFGSVARREGGTVAFIGVDTNDPGASHAVATLIAESHVGYPVLFDTSNEAVAVAYGLGLGLPVTFILDASGTVRREFLGPLTASALTRALAPVVNASAA